VQVQQHKVRDLVHLVWLCISSFSCCHSILGQITAYKLNCKAGIYKCSLNLTQCNELPPISFHWQHIRGAFEFILVTYNSICCQVLYPVLHTKSSVIYVSGNRILQQINLVVTTAIQDESPTYAVHISFDNNGRGRAPNLCSAYLFWKKRSRTSPQPVQCVSLLTTAIPDEPPTYAVRISFVCGTRKPQGKRYKH